jgi:hypothetical protein
MARTKGAKNKSSKTAPVQVVEVSKRPSTYQKLSISEKREIIASRKRRGDNITVAANLSVTPTYVSQVITGRHENKTIVNNMYNLVRGRKPKASK